MTRVIILVVLAFVVLAFVGPFRVSIRHHLSRYYHDAVNVVHPTYVPVHPENAIASTSAPDHPAHFAIDGITNTSWQTDSPGDGTGQSLTLTLAGATDVDKIGFLNGDQDTPQSYLAEPRPEQIYVEFNGTVPFTETITLKDSPSFQSFTVHAKNATSLDITIESVYPSTAGTQASIAEVELFKES